MSKISKITIYKINNKPLHTTLFTHFVEEGINNSFIEIIETPIENLVFSVIPNTKIIIVPGGIEYEGYCRTFILKEDKYKLIENKPENKPENKQENFSNIFIHKSLISILDKVKFNSYNFIY